VAGGTAELVDDIAVPIEFEPFQSVEDCGDGRLSRALAIGILDPQQHLAAALFGVEPVEQRGSGSPDMEKACGRGGKAGDDGIGHGAGAYA
jgi:hypothetical protein